MVLEKFILSYGEKKLANEFKVGESTVRQWKRGYVLPRPVQMLRIRNMTRGKITCDQMITDHFKTSNKNRFSK